MSYRVEYASSNRAKCKGPKPCAGNTIVKDTLRFGSLVDVKGNKSFIWRHWGCVTPKIFKNIKKRIEEARDLDGYDELKPEDQAKLDKAWEEEKVADEDIPETARKPAEEEGNDGDEGAGKKKKRKVPAKKKASSDAEDHDEEAAAPKLLDECIEVRFTGQSAEEAEDFIAAVNRRAWAAGKQKDFIWMAEYAYSCFTRKALRWYEELDEETQNDWKLLKRAILAEFVARQLAPPTVPSAAPALVKYASHAKMDMTQRVIPARSSVLRRSLHRQLPHHQL